MLSVLWNITEYEASEALPICTNKSKEQINTPDAYSHKEQLQIRARQTSLQKSVTGCDNGNAVFASYDTIPEIWNPHTTADELILCGAKLITAKMMGNYQQKIIIWFHY